MTYLWRYFFGQAVLNEINRMPILSKPLEHEGYTFRHIVTPGDFYLLRELADERRRIIDDMFMKGFCLYPERREGPGPKLYFHPPEPGDKWSVDYVPLGKMIMAEKQKKDNGGE